MQLSGAQKQHTSLLYKIPSKAAASKLSPNMLDTDFCFFEGEGEDADEMQTREALSRRLEQMHSEKPDFFALMGNMGAEIFDLKWVQATIHLFTLLGWSLFIAGVVVAIFDVAIEYQTGRANIKTTVLNILKGFFACSLIGIVPVELYKLCISLQHTFASDLGTLFADVQISDMATLCKEVFFANFTITGGALRGLFHLVTLIMFIYCVLKVFFQNILSGNFHETDATSAALPN